MPYLIGNAVTISTTITTGTPAVAVDPSTITLTVTKPDSTVDTFAVGQSHPRRHRDLLVRLSAGDDGCLPVRLDDDQPCIRE
jgi:hypothetical protein